MTQRAALLRRRGEEGREANANPSASDTTSLTKVLQEIRYFRKDTKQQRSAIQLDIANVVAEAQEQVDNVEERVQNPQKGAKQGDKSHTPARKQVT